MPIWNNTSGDWQTGANWIGGAAPAQWGDAYFVNNSNGGFVQVGILQGSVVTIDLLDITLTGTTDLAIRGSLNDAGTAPARLRFERFVGPNDEPEVFVNINTAVGGGEFEISGFGGLELELAHKTHFNVVNAGTTARINASFASGNTIGMVKDGAGLLQLGGNNTAYTGSYTVNDGILHVLNPTGFGSGQVILNGGILKSQGTIGNGFVIRGDANGLQVANGATLTLTDQFRINSSGTITFGDVTDNGTIVLNLSELNLNDGASHRLDGGTVRFGNGLSSNIFSHAGQGLVEVGSGATLDIGGFVTHISNLDMDGGILRSSTGALRVTVNDRNAPTQVQNGTIIGTAGSDVLTINAEHGFNLSGLSFSGWTNGTDFITMNGNGNANILFGSSQRDVINGFDGDDTLTGGGGNDNLNGGAGNDLLILNGANSGSGVNGGDGTDTLRITSGIVDMDGLIGIETLELQGGATIQLTSLEFGGLASNASLSGTGIIEIDMAGATQSVIARTMTVQAGSNIDFEITGSGNNDVIKAANNANNVIIGNTGSDILVGGNLADVIDGGSAIDKIRGDGGADTLTGGDGADVFKFRQIGDSGLGANADVITDFLSGTDKLNFLRIDADANMAGDQAFTFVGTGAFSGGGVGSIRYSDLGADLRVEADVNGDGIADMHVMLQGAGLQTLTVADFVL